MGTKNQCSNARSRWTIYAWEIYAWVRYVVQKFRVLEQYGPMASAGEAGALIFTISYFIICMYLHWVVQRSWFATGVSILGCSMVVGLLGPRIGVVSFFCQIFWVLVCCWCGSLACVQWLNGKCACQFVNFFRLPYPPSSCGVSVWHGLVGFAFVWPCCFFLHGEWRFYFFWNPFGNPDVQGSFLCLKQLLWHPYCLALCGLMYFIGLLLSKWRVMPRFLAVSGGYLSSLRCLFGYPLPLWLSQLSCWFVDAFTRLLETCWGLV